MANSGTTIDSNAVAVILCAGKGSRMKSDYPKVLNTILGRTMISQIIDVLEKSGFQRNIVVCNSENIDLIRGNLNQFDNIDFVIQKEQIGTADAVNSAINETIYKDISSVFIFLGDTPLLTKNDIHSLSSKLEETDILIASFDTVNPYGYGRVIHDQNNSILKIVEEADADDDQRKIKICFSGIMVFKNIDDIILLTEIKNDNKKKEYYYTDVIKIANESGRTVSNIIMDYDHLKGVNTYEQLSEAEIVLQKRIAQYHMERGVKISFPETSHISSDIKIGKNVTIEANVHIGKNVKIGDGVTIRSFSYIEDVEIKEQVIIGPFARIRSNSIIGKDSKVGNFVEIKNSNLSEGVKVSHLSYLGDAEIGKSTNIGAGTITCNFDGEKKYQTKIGQNVFIGSNSSLVAPLNINDETYVASGSVVNKDVPAGALAISRVKQENKIGWAKKVKKKK